jgi:hypothetical protein
MVSLKLIGFFLQLQVFDKVAHQKTFLWSSVGQNLLRLLVILIDLKLFLKFHHLKPLLIEALEPF